ncbi:MAG TPA: GvpL/GvpF family gas vesicle protein [Pyrinomonadaceae bacterium]|nr:GvpL/GvpF family gas vesicle protein [Pyrinomonadaceae bacterium]
MSARKSRRRPGEEGDAGGQGFYVYCVAGSADVSAVFDEDLPAAIEDSNALETVEQGGLAAVVSAVPLADYGEQALQSRLSDVTWTAVRAMRHERVVEHFARRASVVPLRFGTIYTRRDNVAAMLAAKRDELLSIIERLRGREEWGLNVYSDRARLLEEVVSLSPRLRELSEQAARVSPGQSYLMRKKIDSMREAEARAETRRVADAIERELSEAADAASARLRVLKDEAGEQGEVAAKLAFLVERERFDEFRAAAERLAREYEGAGFKLELTGPWPPYNFAAGDG